LCWQFSTDRITIESTNRIAIENTNIVADKLSDCSTALDIGRFR
jgi:hypothetical protein